MARCSPSRVCSTGRGHLVVYAPDVHGLGIDTVVALSRRWLTSAWRRAHAEFNCQLMLTRHRASTEHLRTFRVRTCIWGSRYVAIATQPVHRLQIRPIVHNWGASPTTPASYTRVRAIVYGHAAAARHTDRHADAHDHNTFRVVMTLASPLVPLCCDDHCLVAQTRPL